MLDRVGAFPDLVAEARRLLEQDRPRHAGEDAELERRRASNRHALTLLQDVLREHGLVDVRVAARQRIYALRAARLREIDDFRDRVDPDGYNIEAELLEHYREAYPPTPAADPPHPTAPPPRPRHA